MRGVTLGKKKFAEFSQGVDYRFRGETLCAKSFCGETLLFGNFRGKSISNFAGRHFAHSFLWIFAESRFLFSQGDTYFPLVVFAGSLFPFLRGDTLPGEFCGYFWIVNFHFCGETPCAKNFCGEILPFGNFCREKFIFGNFCGELISIFAGSHVARSFL